MDLALKDKSDYYVLGTPYNWPLRFCPDGYFRVKAMAACKICGREIIVSVRCHRFRSELGTVLSTKAPDPNDERVVTALMLAAANHGVGTANPKNKRFELVSKKFRLKPDLHAKGCPVGMMPRTAEFILAGTDSGHKSRWARG